MQRLRSIAGLDHSKNRNVVFWGNVYHGVDVETHNPLCVEHVQSSAQASWTLDTNKQLPFGGWSKWVDSITAKGRLTYSDGAPCGEMPAVFGQAGGARDDVTLTWSRAVKGGIRCQVRMDNPT